MLESGLPFASMSAFFFPLSLIIVVSCFCISGLLPCSHFFNIHSGALSMSNTPSSASLDNLSLAFFKALGVAIHRAINDFGSVEVIRFLALLKVVDTKGNPPPIKAPAHASH